MSVAYFPQRRIATDLEVAVKLDSSLLQKVNPALNHVLFELKIGNAVYQQAADTVVAVVDMDFVSPAA